MQNICASGECVCASLQSCDGSEYTLQGPAGGDDITGLSPEPAHYQLLSELGENSTHRVRHAQHELKLHLKSLRATVWLSQGGASITWARWTWHGTPPPASWWPWNKPTWTSAPRRSCCSSWWATIHRHLFKRTCASSSQSCVPFRFVYAWLCLKPQNEVLLSRLFRHSNLLTSRLVFSSCCQLWVLTPLMAYGQPLPHLNNFFVLISFDHPHLTFSLSSRLQALLTPY